MIVCEGVSILSAETSECSPEIFASLHPSQQAEIARIKLEKGRVERTLTYHLLNRLTGSHPLLGHTDAGVPFLASSPFNPDISISHCRHCVVVALSDKCKIGIDVEAHNRQIEKIACKFASPHELEAFAGNEALLRLWTIKEAVYKAARTEGLPLVDGIRVTPLTDTEARAAVFADNTLQHFQVFTDTPRQLPGRTISLAAPITL